MFSDFFKPGVLAALASALLFGAGTPLAKVLLDSVSPWLLASLLYLGSGVGLGLYRALRPAGSQQGWLPPLEKGQGRWLAAAVLCGGVIAPVLLMAGLAYLPASHAALLLNAEAVLTAVIAWVVFRENVDRRIALGMGAIVAGALVLSWPTGDASPANWSTALVWPSLAVLAACFFWALDNNFTRKVALADAAWIASVKGLAAGVTNLLLALGLGASWPGLGQVSAALVVGFFAYGVSLTLFVVGLRHLGTARSGAYFSCAPFAGALLAVLLLGETVSWPLLVASGLMAVGVWLHLTEHHAHPHSHEPLAHDHAHTHGSPGDTLDAHHTHQHAPAFVGEHAHRHQHAPVRHSHPHFPDAHHRHDH